MTTRLERLFLLLESGSVSTKKQAASQIGQIPFRESQELRTVLNKLLVLLRSSSWETRIAAGQAVGAIAQNAQAPTSYSLHGLDGLAEISCRFRLRDLNLRKIVAERAPLVGSEGREYESMQDDEASAQRRKAALQEHLGFGRFTEKAGLQELASEIVTDADLINATSSNGPQTPSISGLLDDSLSSRQKNRARRKVRASLSRSTSEDISAGFHGSPVKKLKSQEDTGMLDSDMNDELDPYIAFLDELNRDLFHPDWHIRHGAATGIRELIKGRGSTFAASAAADSKLKDELEFLYFEDAAFRLLCVLALDRFGDFVSYEVVAPVRESCAQALGAVVRYLPDELTDVIINNLLELVSLTDWQARHGGLLGIKYTLLVKRDRIQRFFPRVEPALVDKLRDEIDDVCAVAASALEAVMDEFLNTFPEEIPKVLSSLWNGLLDFDDLTSWTTSFMTLLSSIISRSQTNVVAGQDSTLDELVPRLWPFFEHPSPRIRSCVLSTIEVMIRSSSSSSQHPSWLASVLPTLMKRTFRRAILEHEPDVHDSILKLWNTCVSFSSFTDFFPVLQLMSSAWLALGMQSASTPVDPTLFDLESRGLFNGSSERHLYISGNELAAENPVTRDINVTRTRLLAAKMIASGLERVLRMDPDVFRELCLPLIAFHLQSKSALQKSQMAAVLYYIHEGLTDSRNFEIIQLLNEPQPLLLRCLEENLVYDELCGVVTSMHTTCLSLLQELRAAHASIPPVFSKPVLSMDHCKQLVDPSNWSSMLPRETPKSTLQLLEMKRADTVAVVDSAITEYTNASNRVRLLMAATLIKEGYVSEKLGNVIRPLMDVLKKCLNPILQNLAADSLAQLISRIAGVGSYTATVDKVVKNLCGYLCSDPNQLPSLEDPFPNLANGMSKDEIPLPSATNGILSLIAPLRKSYEPGQKPSNVKNGASNGSSSTADSSSDNACSVIGGERGLKALCSAFSIEELPVRLPGLQQKIITALQTPHTQSDKDPDYINALFILSKLISCFTPTGRETFGQCRPNLVHAVSHRSTAVRYVASQLVSNWAAVPDVKSRQSVMDFVANAVIPIMSSVDSVSARQGACETIACLVDSLGLDVVPYTVKLTVPVMKRMTDQDEAVRLIASQTFGSLVRLLPLGMSGPGDEDAMFLEQLLDSKKMLEFKVAVPIEVKLRPYQQEGVNWLHFLCRYNLHGILCDDMGLGKTLQAVCILASSQQEFRERTDKPIPSLVICPATLIGHWAREVAKFVKPEYLDPVQYEGTPTERARLRKLIPKHSLVVSSYDVVKLDIDYLRHIQWNFVVLDEGHVIRNTKTKLYKAIKQISCLHRLVLSGTPVQNNAQDLWALFDFLMPGLLGSEKRFASRFGKPIDASRDPKATSKEIEEGVIAMENLHKQVLPFILRRLKEDVLDDLPPKIIQDYYCDLSPLQLRLYEDFAKSKAKKEAVESLMSSNGSGANSAFVSLSYLRRVCNHPALVLNQQHPLYGTIMRELDRDKSSLYDIQHAAKFAALQQLLLDCGIGVSDSDQQSVVSSHRALIFCQLTSVLEMIEQHLLRTHMPAVSYLRLDGTIPARERQNVVERFNNDPSIDCLLMTTSIGGLGLNLTGADTVIFVEHDWNPAKDMQAMDRAHRIGQKRVVNVYRLITRGTIEEKIMGLQKFKLHVANSIVTQDNSTLQTMATEQIVDLFSVESTSGSGRSKSSSTNTATEKGAKGWKAALENLETLWENARDYETEYDIGRFLESFGGSSSSL